MIQQLLSYIPNPTKSFTFTFDLLLKIHITYLKLTAIVSSCLDKIKGDENWKTHRYAICQISPHMKGE